MNSKFPKMYLLILLMPFGYLLNILSRSNNGVTEKIYSNGIYRGISWLIGNLWGWLPFSVMELLFPAIILTLIWCISVWIFKLLKNKEERWLIFGKGILNALVVVSIAYFLFIFLWGLNYNRKTLADILCLEVRPSTLEELMEMTEDLLEKTIILRDELQENEAGVIMLIGGKEGAFSRASKGYQRASEHIPAFRKVYGRPKPLLFSSVIAYTHIWGIYSPFTGEPNINTKIPEPMIPSTLMHEFAHQLGFAREDEANYISYLACSFHPDADFRYSGSLHALNYSMNAVYSQDKDAWRNLYNKLSDGIKRDLAENAKYYAAYEGPVREITSKTNDVYLKANNQEDGEQSYGRMVDLLLAQYRYEKKSKR